MSQLPPYGNAIHDAIGSGELAKMREMEKQAEEYLNNHGSVQEALKKLKEEIAKLEQGDG